jgi:hypothetical protein
MGLIKTAIMTGGGIYAVNKLAKAAENRHNNSSPSNPRGYARDHPRDNGYWGPPGRCSPAQTDNYYADNQQQRQWYPANQNDERYLRGYSAGDYGDGKYHSAEGVFEYQERRERESQPPPYPQQQAYGLTPQGQGYNQNGRLGDPSSMGSLASMAMDFVGNEKGEGKRGKKSVKGAQMISEFFGK